MRLAAACLVLAALHAQESATIVGRVVDAGSRQVVPCTVAIRTSRGEVIADHPSFRGGFRSSGTFEKTVPPGETGITVSRGFDYVAVVRKIRLAAGERREEIFELRRRSPLRREGWYCGDNHDHMIHGERTITVDFPYVALAARAEGLDYLSVCQRWNLPRTTPEDLERATRAVSTPDFQLTWNLEAPKNYWRGDVSHCLGHGWTVAMRGRAPDGTDAIEELLRMSAGDYESEKPAFPNFEIQALIHSLGGIVAYSHPCRWWVGKWGGKGIYPAEEKKFVSNMAAELPFDTLAGPTYDTLDILMQPHEKAANAEALKLWFLLLNHGYHIAASGSSDATFDNPGRGIPGKVRVYTRVDGTPTPAGIAEAMKAGRSFVTSGPLLVLEREGRGLRIRAWASGAAGERLTRVELIRNGDVMRAFPVEGGRMEFHTEVSVEESGRAWYVARCFGSDESQVAVTNPVYIEPGGYRAPEPVRARVTGVVTDRATGKPLAGICEVLRMVGENAVVESQSRFQDGRFTREVPATARLRIRVAGRRPVTKSIFMDNAPIRELILNLRPEQLTDWSTFEKVRSLLGEVRLEFKLKP